MKIGLALGGGGAKGFAHIGVINTLVRAGIRIDVVSGTSIGALVGATYLSGTLSELEAYARKLRLTDLVRLLSPTWSTGGMFDGMGALNKLDPFISAKRIEDLPKKFAAVSVDIARAERYVFTAGDLKTALRSSFAIPGIFTPVAIEDPKLKIPRVLVDGGVMDPVPVEVARDLGADFVIAVDLFSNYAGLETSGALPITSEYLWSAGIDAARNYFRSLPSKLPLATSLWPQSAENKAQTKKESAKSLEKAGQKGSARTVLNVIEITERSFAVLQRSLTELQLKTCPPEIAIAPPTMNVGLLDFHKGAQLIEVGAEQAEAAIPQLKALIKAAEEGKAIRSRRSKLEETAPGKTGFGKRIPRRKPRR